MGQSRPFRNVREESGLPPTPDMSLHRSERRSGPILLQKDFAHSSAQD
jgi:hypothetical protein